jgi:ankyrin repeat protein
LLTSGANVNATDEQGRTVLHEAARHNLRAPLAELLRKHGARD